MEINATTVAEWADKMNKRTVECLNSNSVAGSSTWVAFAGSYDAVHNQVKVTYDNGKGDTIRATFFQLRGNDVIEARAAIESIMHQSARMNITNMRRHHFIDCMEFAERDHVEEKKQYWYFREHAKEHAYDYGNPYTYSIGDSRWGDHLSAGLSRAFDVGEKRQNKVGVSDSETVAHAALNQRIDNARNTIELLDSTQSELHAAVSDCDNTFEPIKIDYLNNRASCYVNPYNQCMFAKIPCEAVIKLNSSKCDYTNRKQVCEGSCISINYNLVYDEQFDTVVMSDFRYCFSRYMSSIKMAIDTSLSIQLDITNKLRNADVFPDTDKISVADFKTKVLDVIVQRINKMIASAKAIA